MGSLLALLAYKGNNIHENTLKVTDDIDASRIHTDEGRKEVETAGKVNSDEPEETDPLEIPSDGDESSEVPGPGRGDEDGDDTSTESQPSSQTLHPPLELSNAEEDAERQEEDGDSNDDAEAEAEEEEEDTKATSCTTSTTDTGQEEPLTTKSSLTSETDATDDIEGACGSTSLPPRACPGNGPTPVTVQVENAFAVQVGNGNVLISGGAEGNGNATLTPGADAYQSHSQAEIVAVYIKNCDVVQVGNHNKVIPQENAFVKVCCELGIDPERADDTLARLRHDDVRLEFATKMADSFNVTCKIRAATRGCILLELEVPTEEDRLQLLRMARDGTFQQVLLETFLPEFAAEGRVVNMNLAIGVRNPSQAMVEELQGAVTSSDKEDVKLIEIPDPAVKDGSSTPGQPESRSDQTDRQKQPENRVGLLNGPPNGGDDEMTKVLRRLAVALDRREWEQVSQALRVQQPDRDLSADDTHLRVRVLQEWREGPSYREQFHGLLRALEACGRDDFAVELLQSDPHASPTAPHVPADSAFEDDYSEMSTQLKKAVPVFNQPRKPKKLPVDPRTPLRRLPFRLVKKMAMELDPPGQLANWKDLAAYAGFSMQEISPTRALLNAWGTRNATVQNLLDALRQIGLLNVVDMLSKAESEDEEA
uniref:Death domain-containing protein n=1 Tax=Branchiostoma floridae TaxID=7739 RepID=C3ZQ35_BRAFL|eukprot:XP_002589403.1 hypothetical protein BRAFLDRAFT_121802 [Branchiostoma floridae]